MPLSREDYNEYMRKYMINRYHTRRAEALELLGGKCAVCGSTDRLELDHINRSTKTMDLGHLWSVSKVRYLAELKLCQALCKQHHRNKTSRELSVPHGGGVSGKRNCRCDLCRPVKNAYIRERKARLKKQREAGC